MSLCRWSNSRWYIYETEDDQLSICSDGYTDLNELNKNFEEVVERLAKNDSLYDRKELSNYLSIWRDFKNNKISRQEYVRKLNLYRKNGKRKRFLEDGYLTKSSLSFFYENFPDFKNTYYNVENKNGKIERKHPSEFECIKIKIKEIVEKPYGDEIIYSFYSKNKSVEEKERLTKLYPEYPILKGEEYILFKEENTIFNHFLDSKKSENEAFFKKQIEFFSNKIKELNKKG